MTGDYPGAVHPALSLRGVGISFRGVRALDDVTFDVPAGGVTAVIGPNGAGKTTLFNCIGGIYRHEGDIELSGDSIGHLRAHQRASAGSPARSRRRRCWTTRRSGTTSCSVRAPGHAAASSAVPSPSGARGARTPERATPRGRRSSPSASRTSCVDPAGSLAHADRRRVEVARALVSRPRLLMLDEPAAGLSAAEADELLALVAAHGERDRHDMRPRRTRRRRSSCAPPAGSPCSTPVDFSPPARPPRSRRTRPSWRHTWAPKWRWRS